MTKRGPRMRARVIEGKRIRKAARAALRGGPSRQIRSDKWNRRPEPSLIPDDKEA